VVLPYHRLFPVTNGGMIRFVNLVQQLSHLSNLSVLTFANQVEIEKLKTGFPDLYNVRFISICEKEVELPSMLSWFSRKIAISIYGRILSRKIFAKSNGILIAMYPQLLKLLSTESFDLVVYENLATLDLARLMKLKFPKVVQFYDAHNFDTEIAFQQFKGNEIPKGIYKNIKRIEAGIYKYIDILWTCSERDKLLFDNANNKLINQIDVIPNGAILPEIKARNQQKSTNKILFVGSLNYSPNDIGLQWFISFVLPCISGNFKFQIIGSGTPSIELVGLIKNTPNVEYIGFVESLESYYENSDIVVIPILTGSGTRLKALEAMSYQCAIISTTKGVEGLEISDQVIIQDKPIEFAKSIDQIHLDVDLKKSLGQKARKLVEDNYSWDIVGEKIFKSIY
jgi:glycosyltransferase involved in cell wall biosynthesis